MADSYYKPCAELEICSELIEKYFQTKQYEKCFAGHLELARKGYPLAECQVGYFYLEGLGVEKDVRKAIYWTELSANHGNTTWHGFTKRELALRSILKKHSIGIKNPRSKAMIYPLKNAKNLVLA